MIRIILDSQQGSYVVISRVDRAGNFDTTFRSTGSFREERISRGITTDLQVRIIVVNSNNKSRLNTRAVIYRLDATGQLNLEFVSNGLTVIEDGFSLGLFKPKMDADKIVIASYLREFLIKTDPFIVRLLDYGRLCSAFGNASKGVINVGELAEATDTIIYVDHYYLGGWAFSDKSLVAASKG